MLESIKVLVSRTWHILQIYQCDKDKLWWRFAASYPHQTQKISGLIAVLMGSKPKHLQCQFTMKVCGLCCRSRRDGAVHVLFECPELASTRNVAWRSVTQCMPFQKEAMRTQVALCFIYEEKFLCVWVNTSEHTSWEKFTALKDCEMFGFDYIFYFYKVRDMSFVTYHPSSKQIGHFMGHETVYSNSNSTWLRALAVLFSLPGSVKGRETVYLYYNFSEVLQSWWDRKTKESRKMYPSTE